MYCVITEPENAVNIAQNTPSEQRRSMGLAATGFEANTEQSLTEEAQGSDTERIFKVIDDLFVDDLLAAEASGDHSQIGQDPSDNKQDSTPAPQNPTQIVQDPAMMVEDQSLQTGLDH